MKRKCLAVGIILLFVGIACSPVTNAGNIQEISTINRYPEKGLVRVHCYEYKSDGVIEETLILLPKSEHLKMTQALLLTTSMDEKLEVYKTYGIIPSNETIQKMREKYDQYLIMKNINVSAIQEYRSHLKTAFPPRFILNLNCKIEAGGSFGININLGTNAITQFWNAIALYNYVINGIAPFYLPGIDLGAFSLGILGFVDVSEGTFPDKYERLAFFSMILLGFVGYYIEVIPLPIFNIGSAGYFGYTVFVLAIGTYQPEHLTI